MSNDKRSNSRFSFLMYKLRDLDTHDDTKYWNAYHKRICFLFGV